MLSLPPERRDLARRNLHDRHNSMECGFWFLQAALDAMERKAHEVSLEYWRNHSFFHPPIAMQKYAVSDERVITRQEAAALNEAREFILHRTYAPVTGWEIRHDRDWPIVQAGQIPTQMQYENLTGEFAEGRQPRYDFALWHSYWRKVWERKNKS